jgi:hypothetical protein
MSMLAKELSKDITILILQKNLFINYMPSAQLFTSIPTIQLTRNNSTHPKDKSVINISKTTDI